MGSETMERLRQPGMSLDDANEAMHVAAKRIAERLLDGAGDWIIENLDYEIKSEGIGVSDQDFRDLVKESVREGRVLL